MANGNDQLRDGGVEALVTRIREQGVAAAREEADRILRQAQQEATALRTQTRADAEAELNRARELIRVENDAAQDALRLAARDTLLELRSTIRREFERFVGQLVTQETCDKDFLRELVLTLAGKAAREQLLDHDFDVLLNAGVIDAQAEGDTGHALACRALELSAEALRAGIELVPSTDVCGGARVRLVDEQLELDLSDEAISRLLRRFLLPRFSHIVGDVEV